MTKIINKSKITELTVKEKVAAIWNKLNAIGIYTMEELDKSIKDNPLDIGIFTMPYKDEAKNP